MKKRLVSLASFALLSFSCQSTYNARSNPEPAAPSADQNLWNQYVKSEVGSDSIQAECMPRIVRADPNVGRQGLVMFFHGFTSCPQEFAVLSERLAQAGFDVYLPLLPDHGRSAPDAPTPDRTKSNQNFVKTMNEIASLAPFGDKVLVGLSGGGTLATEAALTSPALWDRILVYAPRAGESLQAIGKIQVPLQFVSVRHEGDTDGTALQKALKNVRNARLCFYPEGIPHAMLRGTSPETDEEAYWLPSLEADSLAFITRGRWFLTHHVRAEKDRQPICRYTL
jgi:pimeloyl-ACP methyl ester carboxylesterase